MGRLKWDYGSSGSLEQNVGHEYFRSGGEQWVAGTVRRVAGNSGSMEQCLASILVFEGNSGSTEQCVAGKYFSGRGEY